MKQLLPLFLFVLLSFGYVGTASGHKNKDTLHAAGGIRFVENKNQWKERILFKADLQQGVLFAEKDCFTFVLNHPDNIQHAHPVVKSASKPSFKYHAYKLHFRNASPNVAVQAENPAKDYHNYFIGNNPEYWASKVKHYEYIYYKDIYQGIDLKLYSQNAFLKYDFVLQPFASPQQIMLEYEGIDNIRIQSKNVVLSTSAGEVVELKPIAYQIIEGEQKNVDVQYVLNKNRITFKIGEYDPAYPLVIDPMLVFSTYTGSTADNWGYTATYDKKRNVYTGGIVFGAGYPVNLGAYDMTFNGGDCDAAIFKLDSTGRTRLFATYLGGNAPDMPHSMVVNELNELIVYGTTGSSDFPTSANAYNRFFRGGESLLYVMGLNFHSGVDIFVSRFSEDGTQLPASTYIGGSKNDGLNYKDTYNSLYLYMGNDSLYGGYGDGSRGELIVDDLNNVYVGSCTFSPDFPTTANAFQPSYGGGEDGVAFKLDYNLSNLIWSSYLGGSGDDAIYSIDVDSKYNLFVAGGANSPNFPTTPGAYRQNYIGGSADGFVTHIAYAGNTIINSTLFGSTAYDQVYFVRIDKVDNVYITGQTKAPDLTLVYSSTGSPLYNVPNSGQFIAKLNPGLNILDWSTVFGSGNLTMGPDLSITGFTIDKCDRVSIIGWGRPFCDRYTQNGSLIPWYTYGTTGLQITADAYQSQTDGQDFYIMSLQPNATGLHYATFLGELHTQTYTGNDHVDGGTTRFDKFGTLYQSVCASCRGSQNFPIVPRPGAWSDSNRSTNCNNAVFSFQLHNDFAVADFINPISADIPICAPYRAQIENMSRGDSFFWDFGDGAGSTDKNPVHIYTQPGLYTITLIAHKSTACFPWDTIQKQFMVLGDTSYYLPDIYTCPNQPEQIGIKPAFGLTYRWNTSNELTDSTISNPFATVQRDQLFYMLIFNGTCTDTIYQWVKMNSISVEAGDSMAICTNPGMLTASSSIPNATYQWSSNNRFTDTLNTSPFDNYALVNFPASQYYYVKITDVNGCTSIDSVYIEYQAINYTLLTEPLKCNNICNGTASVSLVTGVTPPISYRWSTGEITSSIQNLCAGNYSVTVEDAAGCSRTQSFMIGQPPPLFIEPAIVNASCENVCNGSILLQVTGGTPPYRYAWNTGDAIPFLQNLCEGTYKVIISDSNNCRDSISVEIASVGNFTVTTTSTNNTCMNSCTGMATANASGGKAPYTYSWNNGQGGETANGLCEGNHILTVTDSIGCKVYDTMQIQSTYTFEKMKVWADNYEIYEGEKTTLNALALQGVRYLWKPANGLYTPMESNTEAEPLQTTTYYIQCVDLQGCIYIDSLTIHVIYINCGEPDIFIPNAFTPNGDGKNDQFCISSDWITSCSLKIYNRWGEKVFEEKSSNICWDGTYKGKPCGQGVYTYTVEVDCFSNKKFEKKGNITLIR